MVKIPKVGDKILDIDKEQSEEINADKQSLTELTDNFNILDNFVNNEMIVRDNNINGYYIKFSNGLLICMHNATLDYRNATSLQYVWKYPHDFSSSFPRWGSATASAADMGGLVNSTTIRSTFSANDATVRAYGNNLTNSHKIEVSLVVYGFWK